MATVATAGRRRKGRRRDHVAGRFERLYRPFDLTVAALREAGLKCRVTPKPPDDAHERCYATCPSCRTPGCLTLAVSEPVKGAEVELDCWSGCSESEVRRALAADLCRDVVAELRKAA